MRLSNIPPRTMKTLVAERQRPAIGSELTQFSRNLLASREPLQARKRGTKWGAGFEVPWGGIGSATSGTAPRGNRLMPEHGAVQRRSAAASRTVDLLIPPRAGDGRCPAKHTTLETADAFIVRIDFPVPVGVDEIQGELHNDVLEVAYVGKAFTYDHAFLVPAETEPLVEHKESSLVFIFPRQS